MANERKTESIVRSHFERFEGINIEEQSSDNAKIDKLLKSASKKGSGKGKPEFLITLDTNSDFLIVIECKADVTKHESPNRDKYADFAVDGVLLYASYLSKDFDVLAIAVSGESQQKLRVSHFLHLKNEKKPTEVFSDKLLPIQDYLEGYLKSPEKFRQDYNSLLDFAKKLNEKLHTNKILESQRSLLISCILIALENPAFKASYQSHKTPQNLANALIQTVSNELESANIGGKKLENLNIQFSFIKTDTSLSTNEKVLVSLIEEIDDNINSFIRTHEYFDVLGQLYIEFLRYANSDKGLGIVLTPPHITDFFAELAQVNKKSVAYDNCTGTGGFLISAMKKMIEDAKGDTESIKEIKASHLIGTEYQAHIFALAVSNMYIHQDGKTNIINGNCFDETVINEVKKRKPTVGFLNPPYKGDKKNDIEELEFVLNNLECLVDGGTCVSIVPMERALSQKGKGLELKKRLLEKHTLDAVLSMPDELFFSSDAGVVSCILIFTAHKPHPKNKETFFGYFKEDGLVKRKYKGRIDANGKWNAIKDKWVSLYINRKNEPGLSVNRCVTAEDEWCAEAYMDTDYTQIKMNDFRQIVLKYLSFCVSEGNFDLVNLLSSKETTDIPELKPETWRWFTYDELFTLGKGERIVNSDMESGTTPCIRPIDKNNGVHDYIDIEPNHCANTISVNYNGSVAEAFYQPKDYFALDDVNVLNPKFALNVYIGLFLITLIRLEKYRFNYGRKWNLGRMRFSKIKLPITKDNLPDWNFMENYIKSLPYTKLPEQAEF